MPKKRTDKPNAQKARDLSDQDLDGVHGGGPGIKDRSFTLALLETPLDTANVPNSQDPAPGGSIDLSDLEKARHHPLMSTINNTR